MKTGPAAVAAVVVVVTEAAVAAAAVVVTEAAVVAAAAVATAAAVAAGIDSLAPPKQVEPLGCD